MSTSIGCVCTQIVGVGQQVGFYHPHPRRKYLFQNVALRYGDPERQGPASLKAVEVTCKAVHEFVRDLANGYDTLLSSGSTGGVGLSGVQKQRLAGARARLRDSTVLILGM